MISVCSLTRTESGEDVLCSHIEFHESLDLDVSFVVVVRDFLRAKQPGFLSGIEMELDWGGGLEGRVDQGTEDLHGIDSTGTILTRRMKSQ